MNEILDNILLGIIYLFSSFILFFIGKFVYQMFHRNINVKDELVEQDNFAFAVAHTGYFIALLFVIGSAIIGESLGIIEDLINIFSYGMLGILLLNLSIIINDKFILHKFNVRKEIIEDRNAGTGVVEGASAISTGLIIFGSIYGEGDAFISALVFWLIGQILLIITAKIYNLITPYDIHFHIEKDNVAVGIGFAGALISVANLIRFALMPDFESWTFSLMNIGIDFTIALVFLPIARLLADKILLPGQRLTDELINQETPNHGAAIIEAFSYIAVSVLITWCL
ncbi:MAG: DUF350 domain-containing protein [Bacteroidetes bacterium 4572_128]|nr:MAG: DUF350 domain-containing protein [Bacteroidetes bacterium 4572_128]